MIFCIIIIIYLVGTPMGALRLAVAGTGHPISAIILKLSEKPYKSDIKENQKIYSIVNPPIDKATQATLDNWVVTRYGIIYVASHYGW